MSRSSIVIAIIAIFLVFVGRSEGLGNLPPFYVVAHMANTPAAVSWALSKKANGMEMDIRFNSDGSVSQFLHGGICDCSCSPYCLPIGGQTDICQPLGCSCTAATNAIQMFRFLANQSGLALVILDSKVDGAMSESQLVAAGRGVISAVSNELFGRGYNGKVIISTGHPDAMSYIQSAVASANSSPYGSRIFFAFDQTGSSAQEAFCALQVTNRLWTRNIVHGTGISACVPQTFYDGVKMAVTNRDAGAIGLAYIWTIDKESSMRQYLNLRPSAILTNRPDLLYATAISMGYQLATPDTPIPYARTNVTGGTPSSCGCDCDYHPGGCRISFPAPRGRACKCNYRTLQWTCSGSVVGCKNAAAPLCAIPDSTLSSCQNGGGDCDAYNH